MFANRSKAVQILISSIALAAMISQPAQARRGGSFGSRGSRTYLAPRQTTTNQREVAPIQRSMTQPPAQGQVSQPYAAQNYRGPAYDQPRPPSRFGGFAGGLVGGLVAGGLIGSLFGHGMGWGAGYGGMGGGLLISLIQLMILGGLVWFVIGLFRRGRAAAAPAPFARSDYSAYAPNPPAAGQFAGNFAAQPEQMPEIGITERDKFEFERLLGEVQDAFSHEDFGRLRQLTTPEIMSYLSEELSENATHGQRNEVQATKLLEAEVSEAWREGDAEYATIAMRYESIDFMRDRTTGAVISGDSTRPSQTTEVWTFTRPVGGAWKLAAIQE